MAWKYLQLQGAAAGEAGSGGAETLGSSPVFKLMTDRLGVKPGTHRFLRIDSDATYQDQPLYSQLVEQNLAVEIDEATFKGAENFRKRTIGSEDLTGVEGGGGPTM
jgi:hypothetical protein